MRKPLIAGNWKMNLNYEQGQALVSGIAKGLAGQPVPDHAEVAVCPPTVYVAAARQWVGDRPIDTGAQNLYHETSGAFTGEVSAAMLRDCGARYVIIGHSERRHTIGHLEDDRMINLKVRAAQDAGLTPILCIGETITERKAGQTMDVLTFQVTAGLVNAKISGPQDLVIAYEPVWAIGTGEVATPEQAQEAHAHVRDQLRKLVGGVADQVRILYGGSMKPDNAPGLLALADIDGGLIGGASLKADAFLGIISAALAANR